MNADDPKLLPYGRQCIDDDDIAAVTAVLTGAMLTTGPETPAFAAALARTVGAKYATPCSSGTAALHLAAMALELGPRDRVIVPSITFVATANAVRYVGAEVVFADVDADTGMMTPELFAAAIAKAGKPAPTAVFPVYLAGQCADPQAIAEIARSNGMRIVEDAAHALGTRYTSDDGEEHAVGACAHADLTIFSFHPVKTIAMGEGGAVTTNDRRLHDRLTMLVNHGLVRDTHAFRNRDLALDAEGRANPWYYELHELGFNYRASDIHCALGRSQLGKLPRFVERRRALVTRYAQRLAPLAPHIRPLRLSGGCLPAWHLMVALVDFEALGVSRTDVIRRMRDEGVGTQVHYIPVHRQPYYRERYQTQTLPGADRYYARALALPLFYGLEDAEVDRTVDALARATGLA